MSIHNSREMEVSREGNCNRTRRIGGMALPAKFASRIQPQIKQRLSFSEALLVVQLEYLHSHSRFGGQ